MKTKKRERFKIASVEKAHTITHFRNAPGA